MKLKASGRDHREHGFMFPVKESWVQRTSGQITSNALRKSHPSHTKRHGENMGRVKSISIKTLGDDIIRGHINKLSADFKSNKKVLEEITNIKSKRIRNVLAGYISKKMKAIKQDKER